MAGDELEAQRKRAEAPEAALLGQNEQLQVKQLLSTSSVGRQ